MNDKIIIDGVDVSGCEYYQYDMCTATKDNYGDCSSYCKDYDMKDCHFKQLARKTQECEELREKYDQLKAENDELKKQLENFCFDCDVAERMRKVIYAATGGRLSYANYTVEAIEHAYNDQLLIDVEYRTKELEEQLKQAEQKLEKIRQVCAEAKDVENIKDMYTAKLSGLYLKSRQILQIIDEVE